MPYLDTATWQAALQTGFTSDRRRDHQPASCGFFKDAFAIKSLSATQIDNYGFDVPRTHQV